MEKIKLELIVGVFVVIGVVCLGYLSIKLGKLEIVGGNQYEVEADFDSASGIKAGATVEIAGVEVGRVRTIKLNEDRAMVVLSIHDNVKLYADTIASIKTRGIIGEKFMALSPGGGGEPLKAGGKIRDTESGIDLEELVSQFIHGNVK
jgi:phospholipid/cholesterol/gamma-HCH transport system substrate-binding protein